MEEYKKQFIEFMVDCQVLKFGDFVTKSGRQTPFFVNTGFYRTGAFLFPYFAIASYFKRYFSFCSYPIAFQGTGDIGYGGEGNCGSVDLFASGDYSR